MGLVNYGKKIGSKLKERYEEEIGSKLKDRYEEELAAKKQKDAAMKQIRAKARAAALKERETQAVKFAVQRQRIATEQAIKRERQRYVKPQASQRINIMGDSFFGNSKVRIKKPTKKKYKVI